MPRFTKPLVEKYHGTKFSVTIYKDALGDLRKCIYVWDSESPHFEDVIPIYRFNIRPKYHEARLAA